jgi:hypothetical protein
MYITTKVVSSNPVHGEAYSIQHYVIKFVSDLRQVGGFYFVVDTNLTPGMFEVRPTSGLYIFIFI